MAIDKKNGISYSAISKLLGKSKASIANVVSKAFTAPSPPPATPVTYLSVDFSDQTYTNTTTMPTGWREMTTSDTVWDSQTHTSTAVGRWGFDYNATGSSGTGPNGGLSGGVNATTGTQSATNRYMYVETSISQATSAPYGMAVVTLPVLDFTDSLSNSSLKLTFWFHMYGDNLVGSYGVTQHFGVAATTSQTDASSTNEVITGSGFSSENGGGLDITYWTNDDGTSTTTSNRISGQQQTSNGALWRKAEVDLDSLAGQGTVYLHFMLSNIRYFRCDFAVDGVLIEGEE
jgi:hypothetical protein